MFFFARISCRPSREPSGAQTPFPTEIHFAVGQMWSGLRRGLIVGGSGFRIDGLRGRKLRALMTARPQGSGEERILDSGLRNCQSHVHVGTVFGTIVYSPFLICQVLSVSPKCECYMRSLEAESSDDCLLWMRKSGSLNYQKER